MTRGTSRRQFLQQGLVAAGTTAAVASGHWPLTTRELGTSGGLVQAAEPKFRPRYAICNETFGDWEFDRAFALAAECGYQGIEVAPFTLADDVREVSSERRRMVRGQAEQAGLRIVGLHWLLARTKGIHLTSPDADVRRKTAEYLGALADFCGELGGDLLVFGSPRQRNLGQGVTFELGLAYAAEVIERALPRMEQAGVRLALEPLSPGTTNFLRTAAEAVRLVERVDSPRCQLILDCNAMASENVSIPELIRQHHRHLVHFHANDPNRQGPGFGQLDFVPIFEALSEVDFGGWVSVEVFDYKPGAERLARESIGYMRRCVDKVNG